MVRTGSVQAEGDIQANDIVTGLKIENLTVVQASLDQLAEVMGQPEVRLRHTATGELEALSGEQSLLSLSPNLLEAYRLLPQAADLQAAERHRLYAAWLVTRRPQKPEQYLAAQERYIRLKATMSLEKAGLVPHFTGWYPQPDGPPQAHKLNDVTEVVDEHPASVLLGAPGSGKTTILYRLLHEAARRFFTGNRQRLPLLVTLAGYHWEREDPLAFIKRQWQTYVTDDFIEMVRQGQILLLLDGLNEMWRLSSYRDHQQRVNEWEHFLQTHFSDSHSHNRAVVASRTADYEQTLDLPRVEIDPLDDEQIIQFLQAYLRPEADNALAAITRLDLLDLARVPYSLAILTDLYDSRQGDLPPNQGRLFATYADTMLLAEKKQTDLPLEATRIALNQLGYQMQQAGESTLLSAEQIEALIPTSVQVPTQRRPIETPPSAVFDLACRANLLSLDPTGAGQVHAYKFTHHLLQEQFAAADLLRRWQMGEELASLWRSPRSAADMPPAEAGEWDPLPPPPPTGWEQTTIMAAGLLDWADTFVRLVLAVNPALAGRCLSDGAANVNQETEEKIRQALLADLGNADLHRRARLQAGRVLGAVGDPRFEPVEVGDVKVILPDLVEVPGGTATLGSAEAEAFDNEQPVHQVNIAPFYLARYPVTNAEYRCFLEAGGYDAEPYWPPTGWQWRQGKLKTSGPVEQIMESRRTIFQNPSLLEQAVKEGQLLPQEAEKWKALIQLSGEEAQARTQGRYPVQPHKKPYYWDDSAYNRPNQPVVGVTWYEAMAYCVWLTEMLRVSGCEFQVWAQNQLKTRNLEAEAEVRLPTEAEWEWAAGGPQPSRYPWGNDFDPDKANTLEGRILGTNPVGAYPAGAVACGALDLSGNVYEWTHTLFRSYPYQADDGREDPLTEGRRTLRGGSWFDDQRYTRVSARDPNHPDNFILDDVGFRVVVAHILT